MRGKAAIDVSYCVFNGITPAYAGKSPHGNIPFVTLQDHPRLCGEKKNGLSKILTMSGSPPPMRGKVNVHEKNRRA